MKRTLQVLNELERDGVFTRYAIGGAMGATFYTEPLLTFDLDVFVVRSIVCSGAVSAPTSNPPAVIDRRYSETLRAPGYSDQENECIRISLAFRFRRRCAR